MIIQMRKIFSVIVLSLVVATAAASGRFVRVEGENLVKPDGTKLYITGTNLGNWLNPEGYMFGFQEDQLRVDDRPYAKGDGRTG